MKLWKFLVAATLAIAVGVGVGYYAFDVSYNSSQRTEQERLQANIAKTPPPSPAVTVSPLPDKEASAVGEVYITPDVPKADEEQYVLKEYLGRIAVYKTYTSGQTTLMNIIDVSTDALPESDQKLLAKGIDGLSYEEMLQLLEDYTS